MGRRVVSSPMIACGDGVSVLKYVMWLNKDRDEDMVCDAPLSHTARMRVEVEVRGVNGGVDDGDGV
jgi:hypothetical protein